MQELLGIFNAIATFTCYVILVLLFIKLYDGHGVELIKLKALRAGDRESYLVPLIFNRPTNLVNMPLYLFRFLKSGYVKITADQAGGVTWECNGATWTVHIANDTKIVGLSSINPFIQMKEDLNKGSK
ncbi:hypothetical protein [Photobacterium indicum]|jgi:hypothetical protein|uniref:Uncharacterized protein n=1 Tax=Photobacterium indicum TaxID=81447 RepID=A0A2T3LEB4_9GAMM|nr:hypothetical protein [Photobacterium indicum]PSV49714.1 hypothetical protein C9J47_03885 [Photobacterium indicum]